MFTACRIAGVLLLVVLGVANAGSGAEVDHPLGDFPFGLDYERFYHRILANNDLSELPAVGPYSRDRFIVDGERTTSTGLLLTQSPGSDKLRFYTIARERFEGRSDQSGQDFSMFAGGLVFEPSPLIGTQIFFSLDRARALDPDYTGKKWRGMAGDIETAAIYLRKDKLTVTLGRQRMFWGPQPVNLLLSETADPLDMLSLSYEKGRLRFDFLFARLDGSRPDSADSLRYPTATFNDNRYLVAHRLGIRLHRTFRLGFFEASLYGGEGRPPELYYLNPLQFFHTAQLNEFEDDNTMLGMEFSWMPGGGIHAFGQLLVDDIQVDDRIQSDQEPNEIGAMLGIHRAGRGDLLSPDIHLEYVRITNRTYHQTLPRNRYLYRNKLIGHPLGSDADSLSLSLGFWPRNNLLVEIEGAYCRHGEGSIYDPWDEPWMEVEGDYSEPFPTGVVQKGASLAGRVEGYLPCGSYIQRHLYVSLNGGLTRYTDRGNLVGNDRTERWVRFSLSWMGWLEAGIAE